MNTVLTRIYERRAVRKYKVTSIKRETIEQILDAGRMAPSAMNHQPWKFYVLDSPELISHFEEEIGLAVEALSYAAHGIHLSQLASSVFHGAPVVVFVSAPRGDEWAQLDIGMCVQNMMLAAKSLGLDSCPVGFGKFVDKVKSYALLGIPPNELVVLSVVFGYGDEEPDLVKRKRDNVVYVPGLDSSKILKTLPNEARANSTSHDRNTAILEHSDR